MFDIDLLGKNVKRSFDPLEKSSLGKYVYALRDPRDRKIFYVGQGVGDRVFQHFNEAEDYYRKNKISSSKVIRILDIWNQNEDVEWIIIAYQLTDDQANKVESSSYDILSESPNGPPLNDVKPPYSTIQTSDQISQFSAESINPDKFYKRVFLFPIANALADGKSTYDATRGDWYIKESYQQTPAYAMGIKDYISVGAFQVDRWEQAGNKHRFIKSGKETSLLNKNWSKVISVAKGYWQRGNYLIVEFDGKGKFRILRGNGLSPSWIDCEQNSEIIDAAKQDKETVDVDWSFDEVHVIKTFRLSFVISQYSSYRPFSEDSAIGFKVQGGDVEDVKFCLLYGEGPLGGLREGSWNLFPRGLWNELNSIFEYLGKEECTQEILSLDKQYDIDGLRSTAPRGYSIDCQYKMSDPFSWTSRADWFGKGEEEPEILRNLQGLLEKLSYSE